MTAIHIHSTFDAGNIEVLPSKDPLHVRLKIKPDPFTEGTDKRAHFQWFYFQVTQGKNQPLNFSIENASEASYNKAWDGYHTAYSYDREKWLRVPGCSYKNGQLHWHLTPKENYVWFAYFAPYSYERHLQTLAHISATGETQVSSLGSTLDGRSIDLVKIGHGPRKVWIVGRQHPGESMASWFIEGLMHRLMKHGDAAARRLKELATFRIIPNINPDGSVRGHLRTNAAGANLNREWAPTGSYMAPTLERSPEVFHVLAELDKIGCDFYADIHGDEEIPANFLAGSEGIPSYSEKQKEDYAAFQNELLRASIDFQVDLGYLLDDPGTANLAVCTNQIAQRFGCLAMTLEQPFKDTANNPHPEEGWSPARAMQFGSQYLDAMLAFFERK